MRRPTLLDLTSSLVCAASPAWTSPFALDRKRQVLVALTQEQPARNERLEPEGDVLDARDEAGRLHRFRKPPSVGRGVAGTIEEAVDAAKDDDATAPHPAKGTRIANDEPVIEVDERQFAAPGGTLPSPDRSIQADDVAIDVPRLTVREREVVREIVQDWLIERI